MEKDIRDQKVIDLHNSGKSIREIESELKISKSSVSRIVNNYLGKGDIAPKDKPVEVKLTGKEERFTSFVGYKRNDVNEYVHTETGEIVRVVYVKAKTDHIDDKGYFVKLND